MASATTFAAVESLRPSATRVEPAALCPEVPRSFPLSESEKEKHAEGMTDEELVFRVQSKLRPIGEELRSLVPYLREARARFAHPGRRVPVAGQPTFGEWIRKNLAFSDRHVRRLLAAAKEPTDCSGEELEEIPKHQKRDEALWQASRIAHAVLGLDEPDDRDPGGINRKTALKALAYQFLNLARRKQIPVVVRLKELRPADFRALYGILARCLDMQLDQVFGSLGEPERTEALRQLALEINNRYQGKA
jgi:hypothetical protein